MTLDNSSTIHTNFCGDVTWLKNEFTYALKPVDVHVWKIRVPEHFCSLFKESRSVLNEEEVLRAKRFYWEEDFRSYLTGRIILRILLGEYLLQPAAAIQFDSTAKKPAILSNKPIKYNLSYSGEYILISIGLYETGVDIEKIDQDFDYGDIVATCFSPEESDFLKIDERRSRDFFFLQWTRKEALLKYTGQGIIDDLTLIPSLDGDHSIQIGKLKLTENVNLTSFILDERCVGSLARPTQISDIKYLEW